MEPQDVTAKSEPAQDLMTIDAAIKSRMDKLEELKEQMRKQREMLNSFLDNEPTFREASQLAKKASQQKTAVKNQLLKQPQASNLVETIKTIKEQQQEFQEGLSYYLREYQRLTGANEFEGSDGELREIIYIAKLVKKSPFRK